MKPNKCISAPELLLTGLEPTFQDIETAFNEQNIPSHAIDCVNWDAYPLKPDVRFAIAHSNKNIYIRYDVHENTIRAFYTEDNESRPFEDSCVEFFISLDNNKTYYNIESNCIGAILFKGGKSEDRENRQRYDDSITKQIKRYPSMPKEGFESKTGDFRWSIILVIPVRLLGADENYNLKGQVARANFYKCGDKLPEAHFLSWNPIEFEKPSFHRPEFFGELRFE